MLTPRSLERVPETGRLRFIDVSEAQETAMGLQVQQETLAEYSNALLSPYHPTSKRVREVARRVVEANGLGKMKDSGLMTSLPKISIWGGGGEEEGLFGAGDEGVASLSRGGEKRKDIEWEVGPSSSGTVVDAHTGIGICHQRRRDQERIRPPRYVPPLNLSPPLTRPGRRKNIRLYRHPTRL